MNEQQQEFGGPQVANHVEVMGGGDSEDQPLDGYFANKPASEVIADLKLRATNQWNALNARGVPNMWRLIYGAVFGLDPSSGRGSSKGLEFCGAQAQYVRFRIAMTRTHIKQRNNLAAGQRPSFRAVAVNDNAATLSRVPIAGKAVQYVFRESGGEAACLDGLDGDGYFGTGYVWQRWDADAGDVQTVQEQVPAKDQFTGGDLMDPQTGQPVLITRAVKKRAGAPTYTGLFPWEVTRDQNTRKPSWMEVREKASKYELIAHYPELADQLERCALTQSGEPGALEMFQWDLGSVTDDVVLLKHFYHLNCAAVPGGRYIGYVGDVVLWDEACPLQTRLPVTEICSARYFGTPIGYPESTDLLSQQDMLDELLSQWASNVLKFGNQNLWGEDGVEFDPVKFSQGGNYFTLKPEQKPPQVIDYNPIPDGTRYLLEYLPARMSEISGMNSVIRGEPAANITSGVFATLMQSLAEKFVAATQASYDFALNEIGNNTLELIRANASTEFLVQVAGNSNLPYMRAFSANDFEGVHSVYIERQSPVMNNIGGRFEVFDKTWQLPPPARRAAVHMLKTGDDSAYTEFDESCTILIKHENELLSMGRADLAMVSATDDHLLHCQDHRASLDRLRSQEAPQQNTPEFQQWDVAVKAHVQHIGNHAVTWAQTDQVFAAVCGIPAPPQPVPGMGFVPQPGTTGRPANAPGGHDSQQPKGGPGGGGPGSAAPQLPAGPADQQAGSPSAGKPSTTPANDAVARPNGGPSAAGGKSGVSP